MLNMTEALAMIAVFTAALMSKGRTTARDLPEVPARVMAEGVLARRDRQFLHRRVAVQF